MTFHGCGHAKTPTALRAVIGAGGGDHGKEFDEGAKRVEQDILWQHNDGTPAVWLMDGTNVAAFGPTLLNPGSAWDIV